VEPYFAGSQIYDARYTVASYETHKRQVLVSLLLEDPPSSTASPTATVETADGRGDHGFRRLFRRRRKPTLKRQNPESIKLLATLKQVAQGDHPALAVCYDLMGSAVFSLAVRMLRDRALAEDVTQDIFVQVWRQAGNFDTGRGSAEAWIMMIARTRILDRIRSRKAGVVLKSVGDNLPESPAAEDWPDDLAITREDAVNVRQALSELPVDQKQALEMAFFDGLTHVEISEKINVPLGTIKTRIRLGLLKVRDYLRPLMDGSDSLTAPAQEQL
jgi:RNA polymerase sigma-70 factor (ECF subfamily)